MNLPNGTYPAKTGGYQTKFQIAGLNYIGKAKNGVRGLDLTDTVTITDNVCESKLLGKITSLNLHLN